MLIELVCVLFVPFLLLFIMPGDFFKYQPCSHYSSLIMKNPPGPVHFSSPLRSLVLLPPVEAPIHSEFLCFMVCYTHRTILCGLVFYTTFPMYDVFLPLPIKSPGWSIPNTDFVSHTMLLEVQTFKTELDRSWELNLSSQQLRKGGHAVRVVRWISHGADEHSEK